MKKAIASFALFLASFLYSQPKPLILGIQDNPPTSFLEKGNPRGFVVEIISDFAKHYHYSIQYKISTFPELLKGIGKGEIDVIGPIAFSKDRTEYLLYCDEHLYFSWSNLIIPEKARYETLSDLKGKTIGVVKNDIGYQFLRKEFDEQNINVNYREYGNFRGIVNDTENGRIDAGLLYRSGLNHLMKTEKRKFRLRLMPGALFYQSYYFGVNRNKPELVSQLNEYLYNQKNNESGFFQKTYEYWYDEPYNPFLKFLINYSPLLITLVIIAILGFIAFNLALRQKVRKATLEISRQEIFFQNLFQNIPAGIVILNDHSHVIDMNLEFQRLFGFSSDELRDKYLDDHITDDTSRNEALLLNRQILQGLRIDKEVVRQNKNKQPLHLHLIGSPIFLNDQFQGMMFIYIDISDRKKMEEEIIKAKNIESIGVLAGGIAHDFNNMLTGILGNISLARLISKEEKTLEILDKAEKASLKTKGFTQQLLTFSKGGTPLKRVSSIIEVIRDSVDLMLSGSSLKTSICVDDPISNVEIDITQVTQVVNNILLNAKEALPRGGELNIHARMIDYRDESGFLEPGRYVAVSFQDNGPGISEDQQENLFVPFHTSKENGSGLGLAISYSIMKKHNGAITVESHEGEGATFTIYLPATSQSVLKQVKTDSKIRRQARILLMDDEELIREVFRDMLQSLNIEIYTAAGSSETIALFREFRNRNEPFDLVFLDLTIPGDIGGIKTLEQLRIVDPEVRAIATTGYVRHELFDSPEKYHFQDILHKPFQIEELISAISRNLRH